ncbi:MAG: copper resistance protein B [Gammaproteobacteria bacterium]|nr:copper resistance protein B [Gammaproteobacteria bacterium]MDH5276015.1 copper resistance protein B [Gammaproteobacteria bacterium]
MIDRIDRRHVLAVLAPILVLMPPLAMAEDSLPSAVAHMDDNPWQTMFLLDQFEWQDAEEGGALVWDVNAWAGTDDHRVLLRAAGERVDGTTEENRVELLWWHPVASRWDLVAGLRQDLEPVTPRSYAALGVQGLAPWWVHVEATAYLGERGQTAATLEAETDLLLTNRLILAPRLEAEAYGRDDERNGVGNGLSEITAGLRLRYEIRREFAPYFGLEWTGKLGDTADLARADGESVRDARWVAGLQVWF